MDMACVLLALAAVIGAGAVVMIQDLGAMRFFLAFICLAVWPIGVVLGMVVTFCAAAVLFYGIAVTLTGKLGQ